MKKTANFFKRMIASVMACSMIFSLCACDEEDWDDDQTEESVPDESDPGNNGGYRAADVTAMQMSVNRETASMTNTAVTSDINQPLDV